MPWFLPVWNIPYSRELFTVHASIFHSIWSLIALYTQRGQCKDAAAAAGLCIMLRQLIDGIVVIWRAQNSQALFIRRWHEWLRRVGESLPRKRQAVRVWQCQVGGTGESRVGCLRDNVCLPCGGWLSLSGRSGWDVSTCTTKPQLLMAARVIVTTYVHINRVTQPDPTHRSFVYKYLNI